MDTTVTDNLAAQDWKGRVVLVKYGIARVKYAEVSADGIIIHKNKRSDSPVIFAITKENLISIDYPKVGAKEIMLTGVKGFVVRYSDQSATKKLHFYPKGFGRYPSIVDVERVASILLPFSGNTQQSVYDVVDPRQNEKVIVFTSGILIGWVWAGLFGAIALSLSNAISYKIYRSKMDLFFKVFLIAGITAVAFVLSFVVVFLLQFFIRKSL